MGFYAKFLGILCKLSIKEFWKFLWYCKLWLDQQEHIKLTPISAFTLFSLIYAVLLYSVGEGLESSLTSWEHRCKLPRKMRDFCKQKKECKRISDPRNYMSQIQREKNNFNNKKKSSKRISVK